MEDARNNASLMFIEGTHGGALYLLKENAMVPQVWKVVREIKKYLNPEERYLLAVSGGADSLALADAMTLVFAGRPDRLKICHVEHGIRGDEAMHDAELVEKFAEEHQLSFVCYHEDVPEYARIKGMTIEEAARQVRYAKLVEAAQNFSAKIIVTAHQADDQAETVLWKLLRGAGSDGLSAMQVRSNLGALTLLRPLLGLTREDIEAYCLARNIVYCTDSTNGDTHYTRNRIRNKLLPYLEREYNPAIRAALVREAEILAEEQEALSFCTEKYLQDESFCGIVKLEKLGEAHWVDAKRLGELPSAMRKRILRALFFASGGKELSYERTQALERLCYAGEGGKIVQLGAGLEALYKKHKIFIYQGEN